MLLGPLTSTRGSNLLRVRDRQRDMPVTTKRLVVPVQTESAAGNLLNRASALSLLSVNDTKYGRAEIQRNRNRRFIDAVLVSSFVSVLYLPPGRKLS
jgi:hypothetical protein